MDNGRERVRGHLTVVCHVDQLAGRPPGRTRPVPARPQGDLRAIPASRSSACLTLLVFACFWDGKRTWTAADWGEVPPFPPGTALFARLDDAQRALDTSNR